MRFVYLDESGIGNEKSEPFVVVAGVIVDADSQLRNIENYLEEMIKKNVNPLLMKFTRFHAKELYNGGGIFDRTAYPKEVRWRILEDLCAIPKKFGLPVIMGFANRLDYQKSAPWRSQWTQKNLAAGAQMLAATVCIISTEKYLRKHSPGEVAAMVFENNNHAKERIKLSQRLLKDHDFTSQVGPDFMGKQFHAYLPLSKIAESPLFAEKNESSVLQVADAIAWAINRKLRNAPECERFFSNIDGQIRTIRPKVFGPIPSL